MGVAEVGGDEPRRAARLLDGLDDLGAAMRVTPVDDHAVPVLGEPDRRRPSDA
jgi:hypothetical protein